MTLLAAASSPAAMAGLLARHTLVRTVGSGVSALPVEWLDPESAAGDGGDDLVLLGLRIEGATIEDVYAVDLL